MARTVRNPLETRTPVRTISSVMRNAPRQTIRPTQIDFGNRTDSGRPDRQGAGVTSVVRPSGTTGGGRAPITAGGSTRPASSITSTGSRPSTAVKAPVTSVAKPAAKPSAITKPAVKPVTPTKTPTKTPVKPVTSTTKPAVKPAVKPTAKPAVKPITSTTKKPVTPAVKPITSTSKPTTTTKPTTTSKPSSSLTSTLLKTAAGAGAGALINKLLGGTKTGATTTTTKPTGSKTGTSGATGAATNVVKKAATPAAGAAAKTAKQDTAKKAEIAATNPELTEEQIQAEFDRIKAEETSMGVPEGAVLAEDGSYKSTDADGNISTYDKDGNLIGYEGPEATALTQGEGDTTVAGDTSGMTDLGEGYFQDASGNIYSASGDLMYSVGEDGTYYDPSGELIYDPNADTAVADNTYTDPDTGEVWNLGEDGNWTMEGGDTTVADNTWTDPETGEVWNLGDDGTWAMEGGDETDNTDYTVAENTDDTDYTVDDEEPPEAKRGGSIHHKVKGGLPRFEDGGYSDTEEEVQPWQNVDYNYGEEDDPTMTGDNSLYANSGPIKNTYLRNSPASVSNMIEGTDFTADPTIQYFDDGSYIQTFDDGSTITVDSDGNIADTTEASQTTVDDYGNTIVTDGYGNMTVYDPDGNVVPTGSGRVTSAGSGNNQSFAAAQAAAQNRQQQTQPDQTGVLDALKGYITDNPGLAGGAIGALLASLMDQAGSGESAGPSQPVDISELTSFGPRTTDFGPGMTGGRTGTGSPIVSYQDYAEGYGDETPDERLYADLGISGWLNEPEMTDYAEEESPAEDTAEVEEEPAMAAGGATTHYTFGRVIDPAENLGLTQSMKKGGLSQAHTVHSHHTNPVINNRVDFRKGSAVNGAGDGQSDDIPAWLADGEYVMDAELVSMLGNGSNKAGAKVLDKFREEIRAHKRSAPLGKIPPKAKSPLNYLKESMNG